MTNTPASHAAMAYIRRRWPWWEWRGNEYGVEWCGTWPHISLGVSAHVADRFAHVSLHLPIGVLSVGCIGAPAPAVTGPSEEGDR